MGTVRGTCDFVERHDGRSKLLFELTATCPTHPPVLVEILQGTEGVVRLEVRDAVLLPRDSRRFRTPDFSVGDEVEKLQVRVSATCDGEKDSVAEALTCPP